MNIWHRYYFYLPGHRPSDVRSDQQNQNLVDAHTEALQKVIEEYDKKVCVTFQQSPTHSPSSLRAKLLVVVVCVRGVVNASMSRGTFYLANRIWHSWKGKNDHHTCRATLVHRAASQSASQPIRYVEMMLPTTCCAVRGDLCCDRLRSNTTIKIKGRCRIRCTTVGGRRTVSAAGASAGEGQDGRRIRQPQKPGGRGRRHRGGVR